MIFLFLGHVYSVDDRPNSDDVLIYKIGEYANITEVDNFIFINEDTIIDDNSRSILLVLLFLELLGSLFLNHIFYHVVLKFKKRSFIRQFYYYPKK